MPQKTAVKYYRLYCDGYNMSEIARMHKVNPSTVSRGIHRVVQYKCPFAIRCCSCPLPECAIKDEYAFLVNNEMDFEELKKDHIRNPRKRK